jgi:choline monooxygenase
MTDTAAAIFSKEHAMLDEPAEIEQHAKDIGDTRTLPASWYVDPVVHAVERDEIFFNSWRYVCHASLLGKPGQYVTASIFDQDIFVVCGQNNQLRAFYNVCPHRGHRLLDGKGSKKRISCPYHAWTYDLDGRLIRARGDGADGLFAQSDICLSAVRVERLLDFIFINLNHDAAPLADHAPGLAESISTVVPDLSQYRPRDDIGYFGGAYGCNWKVAMDNFLECYHCETAHPSFADIMDISGNRFSFHKNYSYQFIPSAMKANNAAFPLDLQEDALDGHFWFLFPNTIFSVFPGVKNFSVSRVDADGPENTMRFFDSFAPPGVSKEREAARSDWGIAVVNQEDKALCENVQRGMHQRCYDKGYYFVDPDRQNLTEEAVRFFHRLYIDRLRDPLTSRGLL